MHSLSDDVSAIHYEFVLVPTIAGVLEVGKGHERLRYGNNSEG